MTYKPLNFATFLALATAMASASSAYAAQSVQQQQMDALAQGKLKLERIFQQLDTDHSGAISMQEYMAHYDRPVDPKFPEYFEFRAIDSDDSQSLSLSELREATNPFDPKL